MIHTSNKTKALKKLSDLITEINEEGSFLWEHGCFWVDGDLKELKTLIESITEKCD